MRFQIVINLLRLVAAFLLIMEVISDRSRIAPPVIRERRLTKAINCELLIAKSCVEAFVVPASSMCSSLLSLLILWLLLHRSLMLRTLTVIIK